MISLKKNKKIRGKPDQAKSSRGAVNLCNNNDKLLVGKLAVKKKKKTRPRDKTKNIPWKGEILFTSGSQAT